MTEESGDCGGNGGDAALADGLGDLQGQAGAVARGEHAGQVRLHPAVYADERAVHLQPRQQRGERRRLRKMNTPSNGRFFAPARRPETEASPKIASGFGR